MEPVKVNQLAHSIHVNSDQAAVRQMYMSLFGGIVFMEGDGGPEDREMNLLYVADHMIEPMAPMGNDNSKPVARHLARYGQSWQAANFLISGQEALKHAAKNMEEFGVPTASVLDDWEASDEVYFFIHPKYAHGINVEVCCITFGGDPAEYKNWSNDWVVGHPSSLERLSSLNLALKEVEWPRRFLTEAFDGKVIHEDTVNDPEPLDRCFIRIGKQVIGILAPKEKNAGPVSRFIEDRYAGFYSLCWKVSDINAAREHFLNGRAAEMMGVKEAPVASTGQFALDPETVYGSFHEFTEKDPY